MNGKAEYFTCYHCNDRIVFASETQSLHKLVVHLQDEKTPTSVLSLKRFWTEINIRGNLNENGRKKKVTKKKAKKKKIQSKNL